MNINHVINSAFMLQNNHPQPTQEELKLHICEKLLDEFKKTTANDLLPHLRSVDLKKAERQIVVTLTFPWEITVSNFL